MEEFSWKQNWQKLGHHLATNAIPVPRPTVRRKLDTQSFLRTRLWTSHRALQLSRSTPGRQGSKTFNFENSRSSVSRRYTRVCGSEKGMQRATARTYPPQVPVETAVEGSQRSCGKRILCCFGASAWGAGDDVTHVEVRLAGQPCGGAGGRCLLPCPHPHPPYAGLLSAGPEPSTAAPVSASPVQIFVASTRVPMYIPCSGDPVGSHRLVAHERKFFNSCHLQGRAGGDRSGAESFSVKKA